MNQTVTISFVPQQIVTWLLIGMIAGFLASLLLRGRRTDVVGSTVLGLIGAVIGGLLFTLLGVQVPAALLDGITIRYIDIIISFIGALLALFIVRRFWGRRG